MNFDIVVAPPAVVEIAEAAQFITERGYPQTADRWIDAIYETIASLRSSPHRCPLAREDEVFTEELRQLIYKSHRIIFTIRGQTVHVLHVRHAAMDNFRRPK